MKNSLTVRALSLVVALAAMLILSQGVARADDVRIAGSATGSFAGPFVNALSFTGNAFNVETRNGFGALSGAHRLGTFTLRLGAGDMSGTFTLAINFILPSGINGGSATTYTANVSGTGSNIDQGGALLTFSEPVQTFTYTDGEVFGTFTLILPNFIGITSSRTAELGAVIMHADEQPIPEVPEPATLLLLGTGLSGVVGMARRRMKRDKST